MVDKKETAVNQIYQVLVDYGCSIASAENLLDEVKSLIRRCNLPQVRFVSRGAGSFLDDLVPEGESAFSTWLARKDGDGAVSKRETVLPPSSNKKILLSVDDAVECMTEYYKAMILAFDRMAVVEEGQLSFDCDRENKVLQALMTVAAIRACGGNERKIGAILSGLPEMKLPMK